MKPGLNRYAEGNLGMGFLGGGTNEKNKIKSAFAKQAIFPSIYLGIKYLCVTYSLS